LDNYSYLKVCRPRCVKLIQHKLCIYFHIRAVKTQQTICQIVSLCNIQQNYVICNYMFRLLTRPKYVVLYYILLYITQWYHLTYCLLCFDWTYIEVYTHFMLYLYNCFSNNFGFSLSLSFNLPGLSSIINDG
jgi:hypothetical protein